MKKEDVLNIFHTLISIIYIIIIGFLFSMSLFSTSAITIEPETEHTFFLQDNALRNALIVLIFVVLLFVLKRTRIVSNRINKINSNKKKFKLIKTICFLLIFIVCFIYVLSGKFSLGADQFSVQDISSQIIKGDFSSLNRGEYLDKNPHQIGLVLISSIFSFIFRENSVFVLEVVNCILIALFYKELSEILDDFGCSFFPQLLVLLSAFVFPVFMFYSYFVYGTIPGALLSLIAFKYENRYLNNNRIGDIIISFMCILFALFFKQNYIIFAMAMIIYAVFKYVDNKKLECIIFGFVICLSIMLQSFVPKLIMENISHKKIDGGISSYAYIAMGMQDGDRAPGWFNGYNHDSYYSANFDTDIQKQKSIKYIDDRIEYFNNNPDEALEFYSKKISSIWNNPTFQCFWNLEGKIPEEEMSNCPPWLLWIASKKGSSIIAKYLNIIMSIIYLGSVLYGISLFNREKRVTDLMFVIYFIGSFLFQLMWEGKAQYTFVNFILLIPLAILGYDRLLKFAINRNIGFTKIISVCIVIILLFTFVLNKFPFLYVDNDNYYNYLYYSIYENK